MTLLRIAVTWRTKEQYVVKILLNERVWKLIWRIMWHLNNIILDCFKLYQLSLFITSLAKNIDSTSNSKWLVAISLLTHVLCSKCSWKFPLEKIFIWPSKTNIVSSTEKLFREEFYKYFLKSKWDVSLLILHISKRSFNMLCCIALTIF